MTTSVKICGITNIADAQNAITSGAAYLGFIFVPSSERAIDETSALAILPSIAHKVKTVAVFKDSPLDEVNRLVKVLNFDFVQLHGSESPDFCSGVEVPVIKALQITPDSTDEELRSQIDQYSDCAYLLFDKPKGCEFSNWLDLALGKMEMLNNCGRYFFAGGLQHSNVRQVLNRIKPDALDVASGVELSPGKKDMTKMIAFCDAVNDSATVANEAVS